MAHAFLQLRKFEAPAAPATPELIVESLPEPPSDTKLVVDVCDPLPLGTYVASIQKAGRFRRLHKVGECPLLPGVDYREYEAFGASMPHASKFAALCRRCFKEGVPATLSSSDESATSASVSG